MILHNSPKSINVINPLLVSVEERNVTFNFLIRMFQLEHFNDEYYSLLNKNPILKRSTLISLNVKLFEDNLIRVGGRLTASNFSFDKYPIMLSSKSRFIELYITYVHKCYFHASKSFIINFVQSKFWVVGNLVSLVKKIIHKRVRCARINAKLQEQFMADLSKARTIISCPFSITGVDFAGPFRAKCVNHRTTKFFKVSISVFLYFTSRAVHLELVEDLSTEAFLAAVKRFGSRRGLPKIMYSDNGTNFVSLSNILKHSEPFFAKNLIEWRFITPHSPHQGGLWEASVRSGKSCLVKAVCNQILSFNEFHTVLAKIEAVLNSRPIAYTI